MSFQSVSNSVYSSKYQLFDKHGNEIDESRSHSFMRVAHALAKNEKDFQYWADAFFEAMLNGAIPAGRIMGNAGAEEHKPNTSLMNCTVSDTIYDHIEGIGQAVKESLVTLSGGSGIGYEFSTLRPRGSYVNGVKAQTSGPLPFADIFDKGCFTIASAGGRRGAQMATFDLRHPDVLSFIKAKREDGRFRQFNISVLVPHSFFNEEKDWVFRFPIRNSDPALDTAETMWDTWHVEDFAYITNEHGQTLFKIYGKMPKTELWDLILQSNYDYAEPGVIFVDRFNEENNLWFCEELRASNPCLHPDTLVETVEGRVRIADIKEPTKVYTSMPDGSLGIANSSSSWVSKKNAKVWKITTQNGKELKVTANHKILTHNRGWVEAQDLKLGDRIVQLCRKRRGAQYSGVKLTSEDNCAYRMEHRMIAESVFGDLGDSIVHHLNNDSYDNHIDNFEVMSAEAHNRLTASTTHLQNHQIHGDDGKFVTTGKSFKRIIPMPEHLKSNMKNDRSNAVVEIVKDFETVDVYDLFVEDTHNFIGNFMVVHNCGEVPLPPNGSCLLGSIDLTQFVEQPFTDEASFDFSQFANTVDVFTRILDNVVEFNNLPLQAQREEIIRKRRHGMGFFGLGSALILLGIRYDSPQALEFAEKVTKLMAIRGYITGCALAEEKGSAPVLDEYFEITPEIVRKNELFKDRLGQKVKGIELFLASPYMQRLLAEEPILKNQLLQHGCRFSHHTSIAPTGTISLAFGNNTSGGIEPSFSHQYFRNLTVEGKKTRQQEAVYSKEFLLYKELYGQNKTDEELLKHLPDYFVTADTISWKAHVDMVAVVQKWVDSSISKTVNTPTNITLEEFKGIYDYAYVVGCKAVSTFRYNPETLGSILSRSEDLAKSRYEFKLADGTVIQCAGGDRVEYDGEVTTAENLFSALKENTYGKF